MNVPAHLGGHRVLLLVERSIALLGVGAMLVAFAAYGLEYKGRRQVRLEREGSSQSFPSGERPIDTVRRDRLEIEAVHLVVPIVEGTSLLSLLQGAGHIEGTSFPGQPGTTAYAGHRDTFFRPLESVRPGMRMTVTDRQGEHDYTVRSTGIVSPQQTEVLQSGNSSRLVLVTCYPFHYFGSAPKRFVVVAEPSRSTNGR